MAELRQMPITPTVSGHDTSNPLIVRMRSEFGLAIVDGVLQRAQEEHYAEVFRDPDGTARVECSCEHRWSIAPMKANNHEILATFNSHLSFYTRTKMRTD